LDASESSNTQDALSSAIDYLSWISPPYAFESNLPACFVHVKHAKWIFVHLAQYGHKGEAWSPPA